MKYIIFIISVMLLIACNKHQSDKSSHGNIERDHKHGHHEAHHGGQRSANEHMHQSTTQELIRRFESPERDEYQKPDEVLSYLGDIEGKTIIDIGAGSGYFSMRLAARGANVIAADVNDEFLSYIDKRIQENNLKNIVLRKIPYDSPDLKDQEVDMVLLVNTYHHIENRSDYFVNVMNGTKENGELVIIDFFKTEAPVGPPVHHKISMDVIIAELKAAGYSSFEFNVVLLPYQFIIRAK